MDRRGDHFGHRGGRDRLGRYELDAPDHEDNAEPSTAERVRVTAVSILRDIYADNERVSVVDLGDPSWAGPRTDDPVELMAAMPDAHTVRVIPRWDNVGVLWCGRFGFDQGHETRSYPALPHTDPEFRTALTDLTAPLVRTALNAAQRARLADYANDAPRRRLPSPRRHPNLN